MKSANMHRLGRSGRRTLASLLMGFVALVAILPAAIATEGAEPVNAVFEGRLIDLSTDWEDAQACMVWREVGVVECFRTEKAMDARIAELEGELDSAKTMTASGTCSGYMRLYKNSGYGGQVLYLRGRLQWTNLSGYSFSNETSSFKIGPCSAYLADGSLGGGSWYPTSQSQAWDVAPNMATGWNDRISSVYIK
ncbi:MAG: hypothetical protein QNL12_03685 [Acidimicrobiia bacterium]|nr:hypothetical protein [Acidimicrobiia bacterium]MDX2466391.1 hypothetical protein [Acidimicrobiia bacterium]